MRGGIGIAAWVAAIAALAVPAAAFGQASPSAFTAATPYDAERRVTGTIAPDPDGDGPLGLDRVHRVQPGRHRL
jgi:hypothetical protein